MVDNLLKEKESIQVLVDTRKAELVALKEKRKKLEAKVVMYKKITNYHLICVTHFFESFIRNTSGN